MKTDRVDIWGEEIFVGNRVRVGMKIYIVRYGNFKYFGTERIGTYLESESRKKPCDTMPLSQAKAIIKITHNSDGKKITYKEEQIISA
jgi:hypothetical protein